MSASLDSIELEIHCRIGSSEINGTDERRVADIHCRIGSSENVQNPDTGQFMIHCRIGSSENAGAEHPQASAPSATHGSGDPRMLHRPSTPQC